MNKLRKDLQKFKNQAKEKQVEDEGIGEQSGNY